MSHFKSWPTRLAFLLVFVSLCYAQAFADHIPPITIWQNAREFQTRDGQTLRLHRNEFRMVFPLREGQSAKLSGGATPEPDPLEAFGAGRAMAVPYDGFFITWEAFHILPYDRQEATPWVHLWDPNKHLVYWDVDKFYDNSKSPARELPWDQIPDLNLVFLHSDGAPLRFKIEWID